MQIISARTGISKIIYSYTFLLYNGTGTMQLAAIPAAYNIQTIAKTKHMFFGNFTEK